MPPSNRCYWVRQDKAELILERTYLKAWQGKLPSWLAGPVASTSGAHICRMNNFQRKGSHRGWANGKQGYLRADWKGRMGLTGYNRAPSAGQQRGSLVLGSKKRVQVVGKGLGGVLVDTLESPV